MPGFNTESGGGLTDAQINLIVQQMRARWRKPDPFNGATPPPYKATHPGDSGKGQQVYVAACARCHGESAQKAGKDGSILDGTFLALLDEQTIRTTVIAGRPDAGQPDWRNHIQGRSLTDDEITDVSAWLLAQRPASPGQPYPNQNPTSERPGEGQPLANSRR
jgi:cytochrome c oxidase cbb3-type subunit 3/ubiquinol-cytochrome c reductase cytochrome c subunit